MNDAWGGRFGFQGDAERRAQSYLAMSAHARRMAQDADNDQLRKSFLQIALQWEHLARDVETAAFDQGVVVDEGPEKPGTPPRTKFRY